MNLDSESGHKYVGELSERLGVEFQNIQTAQQSALGAKGALRAAIQEGGILTGDENSDRAFVVFGSLARNEFTGKGKSDVDWTLLVDGMTSLHDMDTVHKIRDAIDDLQYGGPNREGAFAKLSFSHELVHQIGGSDDTNSNMTQRLLLILESSALYGETVRSRVLRNLLFRYVLEDESFLNGGNDEHVPRFLLNDVVRFWRTMAVDFQTKKRERKNEGVAIRNIKLRFSRKLLFLAGLVTCFSFALDRESSEGIWKKSDANARGLGAVDYLERVADIPPLDLLAKVLLRFADLDSSSRKLFSAYDFFLQLMSDSSKRAQLAGLPQDKMASDEVYLEARSEARKFQEAIGEIFLYSSDKTALRNLTIKYGVF